MVRSASSGSPAGRFFRGRQRRAAGFTLIELLVVLVILAIVVSMVVISATPSPVRELRNDAERVALLLQLAREEAQVRATPIRFLTDGTEYRFAFFRNNRWWPLEGDNDLRPRRFSAETRVVVERADGTSRIEFGRDVVEPPYRIWMSRAGQTFLVYANGMGAFEVTQQP